MQLMTASVKCGLFVNTYEVRGNIVRLSHVSRSMPWFVLWVLEVRHGAAISISNTGWAKKSVTTLKSRGDAVFSMRAKI